VHPTGEKFPRRVIGSLNRNQGGRLSAEEAIIGGECGLVAEEKSPETLQGNRGRGG
jgi:hypothetical protein